ncbi:DCC1-like thiol-disulfide oxidoreductase family protein [Cognatishimia sp. WU-CL00825]|uniref:thiol-disulfide oxidoreductase DCC family protein n=1 Tax=Cognatishimia sp. WU-CL00825 TaxID=3127658 RepID=UPI0031075C73
MTQQNTVVVFDGTCVLCTGFFRFVLQRDRAELIQFATAQSPFGQTQFGALGLPTENLDTLLLLQDGRVYQKLDAICEILRHLGWPWRVFTVLRFLPQGLKDRLYGLIARNRYRVFGRSDVCMRPTEATRGRFLPDGGG